MKGRECGTENRSSGKENARFLPIEKILYRPVGQVDLTGLLAHFRARAWWRELQLAAERLSLGLLDDSLPN
jgi:hypothetical protein